MALIQRRGAFLYPRAHQARHHKTGTPPEERVREEARKGTSLRTCFAARRRFIGYEICTKILWKKQSL
jgi:hypothetical protein